MRQRCHRFRPARHLFKLARASGVSNEALLLADAQTSGGFLLVGEIPGSTVIGHLAAAEGKTLVLR
jgi:hypothetical protein